MPSSLKSYKNIGKRLELAADSEAIFSRYQFAPRRKKGKPGNYAKVGAPRAIDAGVLLLLIDAFSKGCTITEARAYAKISETALDNFILLNPFFRREIDELRQLPLVLARNSVYEGMKKSGELALKYLERKLPQEFSLKADISHSFEFTGISLDKPKEVVIEQEASTSHIE
jgi:hypothetical protein